MKDNTYTNVTNSNNSFAWQNANGGGEYVDTLKLANISAGKGLSVDAKGGVAIDIPAVQATPTPAPQIDANGKIIPAVPLTPAQQEAQRQADLNKAIQNLASQPGQAWIGQLANDPKIQVQWNQVQTAAQHWNYNHDGLTPEGAAVVAIVVTYFTAGAASGAAGAMTGAAAGTTTVASAALAAGMTTLASQAAVALINNKGDIGGTLNDLGSSQNVRALVTAMVTAGALQGLNTTFGMEKVNAQSTFVQQLQKNLIDNTAGAVVNHAINGGDLKTQLEQSLKSAFIDTGSAQSANWIGDQYQNGTLNNFTHQLAHAIAGCAAGAAKSGDCSSGALGAVVGEMSAELYGGNRTNASNLDLPGLQTDTVNFARMMAGIAVAITGGDAAAINLAASAGGNAAENNYLNHQEVNTLLAQLNACKTAVCRNDLIASAQALSNGRNYADLLNNKTLAASVTDGSILLQTAINNPDSGLAPNAGFSGYAVNNGLQNLLGINDSQLAAANNVPTLQAAPDPSAAGINAILNDHQQWANVGTPALMAMPGTIGLLAGTVAVASGSYQLGQGGAALSVGDYGTGTGNTIMGLLSITGGFASASVSIGKTSSLVSAGAGDVGVNSVDVATIDSTASYRGYLNDKFGRTGDLNLDINIRGNQETATNFFLSQGVPDGNIPSYMIGIDFTKPVTSQTMGGSKQLWQYQTPGAPQGNWYSLDPSVQPTELGIGSFGLNRATQMAEPKILNSYMTKEPVNVLRSTSAAVDDFWSVPGQSYPTTGGAQQLFSTQKPLFIPVPQK